MGSARDATAGIEVRQNHMIFTRQNPVSRIARDPGGASGDSRFSHSFSIRSLGTTLYLRKLGCPTAQWTHTLVQNRMSYTRRNSSKRH